MLTLDKCMGIRLVACNAVSMMECPVRLDQIVFENASTTFQSVNVLCVTKNTSMNRMAKMLCHFLTTCTH